MILHQLILAEKFRLLSIHSKEHFSRFVLGNLEKCFSFLFFYFMKFLQQEIATLFKTLLLLFILSFFIDILVIKMFLIYLI